MERIFIKFLGSIVLIVSIILLQHTFALLTVGISTTGTVVEVARSGRPAGSHGGKGYMFTPMVEFKDKNGKTHRFTSAVSNSGNIAHSVGESVDVIYLEAVPEGASVYSIFELWVPGIFFGALGLVMLFKR